MSGPLWQRISFHYVMLTSYGRAVADFMWGDRSLSVVSVRVVAKLAVTLALAWVVHDGLAGRLLSVTLKQGESLTDSFARANAILGNITLPKDLDYTAVTICLDAKPPAPGGCEGSQFGEQTTYAIGYQLIAKYKDRPPGRVAAGTIYEVKPYFQPYLRLVRAAHISESVDTLLRKIEVVVFNGPKTAITELKLCNGTRTLELSENCNKTKEIGESLGTLTSGIDMPSAGAYSANALTVQEVIDKARLWSLFFGPIQFGTLCIFVYAVLETLGLWLRWVAPRNLLYTVKHETHRTDSTKLPGNIAAGTSNTEQSGGGFADRASLVPRKMPDALREVLSSRTRSIGDRLYLVDLKAAVDLPNSPPATPQEFVSVHSSYRNYLQEEAIARQDSLETLGDTMLKLAFLGTVAGISAALFSARGLDTADPILRLSTKADMYSGIGLGFGTTLLGILLSILAAQLRTVLAAAWSREIGLSYQLILDFGLARLRRQADYVPRQEIVRIEDVAEPPETTFELLGILVVAAIVFASLIVYGPRLIDLLQSE